MMKSLLRHILLLVVVLVPMCFLKAQELPVLPDDPAISSGVLPNGTKYYVMSNRDLKGFADFALVQRTGMGNIQDSVAWRTVHVARESLSSLPRCLAPSLQSFVTSHGVTPDKDGYVKVSDDATVFRFRNVLLSSPEVLDSTLLVLLDVVDRGSRADDEFIRRWYAPSDHAVVIVGDIDAAQVIGKLRLISLMTPAAASSPRIGYKWEDRDSVLVVKDVDSLRNISSISMTWRSARTPVEYMNTVQPAIYEMFLAELGILAEEYIRAAMKSHDIPVADISCSHVMSAERSGDESFTVSVHTLPEFFEDAVSVTAGALAGIDGGNVSVSDISRIRRMCIDAVHESSAEPVLSNSAYVDKCIASFLYNGSLASLKSKVDFFASRQISDSTELRLFNNIASALLDPERNMEFRYVSSHEPDSVRSVFSRAWKEQCDTSFVREPVHFPEDIPLFENEGKMKIRVMRTDHMSGSRVWVFSNGFTVVYRKMDTEGRMHWCLAQNGGYGSISDLEPGEGGYISDYIFHSTIAGMPAADFFQVLEGEGISFEPEVRLSETLFSGYAPKDRLDLLMRSLLAVMNNRVLDEDSARYYAGCEIARTEFLRGSVQERKMLIDGIMSPDDRYTSLRNLSSLSPELPHKADRFFAKQSEKMNDGILLLIGDIDEDELKKLLLDYIGGFRTTDKAFRRAKIRQQIPSGESTYTVKGDLNSVDIAMSAPLVLTADNFMAAEIASRILEKHLSEAIADTGMYLELHHDCRIYPHERFNVLISIGEASPDGFASDVEHTGPMEALSIIRSCLSSIDEISISDSDMAVMKSQLKNSISIMMTSPSYWMKVIPRRFLSGKDFTTSYATRIDAVTSERIRSILSDLENGSKVEYIISR